MIIVSLQFLNTAKVSSGVDGGGSSHTLALLPARINIELWSGNDFTSSRACVVSFSRKPLWSGPLRVFEAGLKWLSPVLQGCSAVLLHK
jgi:hypothetical protein